MKQFKLTFVLTVLMGMVGLQAFAYYEDTKVEVGGLCYYLDITNGQAMVTSKPTGYYSGAIEIPPKFEHEGETSNIFYYKGTFSVTSIASGAFKDCTGLTSITIPESVTSIGGNAFYGCSKLTSVTIPNSVTSIGGSAFEGCSGLTSITIPESVTSIGGNAFYGCSKLTSVTIPNSVTSIGNDAFKGTAWYNSQTDGLVYAGKVAYQYKGEMPANTSITIKEGTLGIANGAFQDCSGLTSVTIPNSVTSIGASAFRDCSGLTSVIIGNSVTSIGIRAFDGCSGLTSVTLNSNAIASKAYTSSNNIKNIFGEQVTEYIIGEDVTSIGEGAFYGCSGLTSVTIPNSVTSIGYDAFKNCSGLTSVTLNSNAIASKAYTSSNNIKNIFGEQVTEYIIGEDVTSIGRDAFYGCSKLTSVTIPNSVTSIGSWAFSSCSNLTSVTLNSNAIASKANTIFNNNIMDIFGGQVKEYIIGEDVTSIGNGAFIGCSGLTSVTLNSNAIASKAYTSSKNIKSIFGGQVTEYIIGEDVTSIGYGAFQDCSGLTSVTIGNSVTSIGDYAFQDCSGLTSVTIGNSVTSIGDYAFQKCSGLTSVTIGNSVKSIGYHAFEGCSGLTSITIPNSVTSIGEGAFGSCGLTSITIPNSVTSIGSWAFSSCSKLTSVTALNPTPIAITQNVFTNRTNATLYVPKGSKDAYKAKNYWKEFKEIVEIETTGIDQISFQENGNGEQVIDQEGAVWYTIDGKQIDKPKKGINIIRMSDGTTRKVLVK